MTQTASNNTSLLKRVIHVTVVALATASSLALLGAVPAKWAMDRRAKLQREQRVVAPAAIEIAKPQVVAAAAADEVVSPQLRAVTETRELLVENIAAVVETLRENAPRTRVVRMEVTAYCPCTKCCGPNAHGVTASGKPVSYNDGKFVAADTNVLAFGKQLVIPGYADGERVEVIDRGGAIKGNKLDLYFPTHAEALVWGRQHLDVTVFE